MTVIPKTEEEKAKVNIATWLIGFALLKVGLQLGLYFWAKSVNRG